MGVYVLDIAQFGFVPINGFVLDEKIIIVGQIHIYIYIYIYIYIPTWHYTWSMISC